MTLDSSIQPGVSSQRVAAQWHNTWRVVASDMSAPYWVRPTPKHGKRTDKVARRKRQQTKMLDYNQRQCMSKCSITLRLACRHIRPGHVLQLEHNDAQRGSAESFAHCDASNSATPPCTASILNSGTTVPMRWSACARKADRTTDPESLRLVQLIRSVRRHAWTPAALRARLVRR